MSLAPDETPVYDSSQVRSYALEELENVFRYRNLIAQLTQRDILTRYRRSVLGVAWTMLNPLGMMVVLTLAFSAIFRFNVEHYPAYVLSGILAWNFFSQTSTASMFNLVWGGDILKRIYIPRTSFALAAVTTGLVNLTLALVPLLLVMLVTGAPIRPTVLFLPVPMFFLVCFTLGFGLLLSTFAAYFPDLAEMYQIGLSGWMYLTPIIYPEAVLPEQYRFWLTRLNPLYYLIKSFRMPLYDGLLPPWTTIAISGVISITVLLAGWYVFTRKSDEFAYRL